jgi:D-sedoheptulose 7-phosphate isomerase
MHQLRTYFDASSSGAEYAAQYAKRMAAILQAFDSAAIGKTIEILQAASANDKTIFTMGNGGSAAIASTFVNDLGPNTIVEGLPPFRMVSLTDNVDSVTSLANDSGYQHIFEYQLRAMMRPGDVVVAMSVSGNSPNIVRGVEYANSNGATSIGWTGFAGGKLGEICDVHVNIPTALDEYGPAEDMFSVLGHMCATYITMKRGRNLHH